MSASGLVNNLITTADSTLSNLPRGVTQAITPRPATSKSVGFMSGSAPVAPNTLGTAPTAPTTAPPQTPVKNSVISGLGVKKINSGDIKLVTNAEKWWFSLLIGIIYFIFASPALFGITNGITNALCLPSTCNCGGATIFGLFLHTIIVVLIVRGLLQLIGTSAIPLIDF